MSTTQSAPSVASVLIVDDQPDVADALSALVRALGHVARTAYDAETAVALTRSMHPDVALVDFSMRDAGGTDLTSRLRSEAHNPIRLIAMSGYDDQHLGEPSYDDFLLKPPEIARLVSVLRDSRDMRRDR